LSSRLLSFLSSEPAVRIVGPERPGPARLPTISAVPRFRSDWIRRASASAGDISTPPGSLTNWAWPSGTASFGYPWSTTIPWRKWTG
jgi:hypothetical protein